MSNNTARLAREWAQEKLAVEYDYPERVRGKELAAVEHIMATTTEPTMDEVEWNEDTHALTGAVVDVGSGPVDVVMLAGSVDGIDYATLDGKFGYEPRYYFTPNGKRYELREVTDKPENPETLRTVEDYENAPEGTIVSGRLAYPIAKGASGDWANGDGTDFQAIYLAGASRQVLRWGWGE